MSFRPDPIATPGIRLIVLYKFAKGCLEAAGAVVLAVGPSLGLDQAFVRAALALQHHATRAWAVHLSYNLQALVTPGHLQLAAIALVLDAALTLVEGWGLRRGHWWGPWLVVVASGLLLPFEVRHLVSRPRPGRLIVLLVNALIVGYLARRVLVEHRARRAG
jgi:uncharacterized membrane protein (DUF2068 family)